MDATEEVNLHGHVHNRLGDYKRDSETYSTAVNRLLPYNGEVMASPQNERRRIYVTPQVYDELNGTAGMAWGMGDVIDQYLLEAGYARRKEDILDRGTILRLGAGRD